jgi:hypothetical protein
MCALAAFVYAKVHIEDRDIVGSSYVLPKHGGLGINGLLFSQFDGASSRLVGDLPFLVVSLT